MAKKMLEVHELTTKYITRQGEDVYSVDHVSLDIEEGKSLGIAGESGCGKSTLALSLMGYYFPPLHYTSGEIIIEGHTDSSGSYESNLKLSQDRALQVALYCLRMPSLDRARKQQLQKILTAKGRSYADLIYNSAGVEDPEASRRVEFKFSLKDSEMIEEMNRILSGD